MDTKMIHLETIPLNLQQEVLSRFGHPYGFQDRGSSKVECSSLEKDIPSSVFVTDKTLQHLPEMGLNVKKHQESICEKPLLQLEFQMMNEDKLNLQSNENRIQYLQKLGCPRRFYNRVYKAKQSS